MPRLIYAREPLDDLSGPVIFLAGPTPRAANPCPSWRPEALLIFATLEFEGTLLIPEDRDGSKQFNYDNQIDWEDNGLQAATTILFWVPRSQVLPGLTTNVEFGLWLKSGKIIYGRPEGAQQTRYLDYMYQKYVEREPLPTLRETIERAIAQARIYA